MSYLTIPLESKHNRSSFSCGSNLLDNYFHRQVGQDVKRKLTACFVLIDKKTGSIAGYYTLSGHSISSSLIPDSFRKKLPKSYSLIPTILLGRMAIDLTFQGKGLGKMLLVDALMRCYDSAASVGAFAVVVDPLDKSAEQFYAKYGFIKLPDSGKMFLPMKTIDDLFESGNKEG